LNGTGTKTEPGAVELRANKEKADEIGWKQGDKIKGRFHQIYADNAADLKRLIGILNGTA
ncbi:hypothetical protein, partial [Corynebacterium sp. HMSC29G08]|uniref:hypothetical protein n=1 Tax=Corynebacterium sp. HMSC29G08 TaxID=1581069 RepID=UPI001AEF5386